MKKKAGTKKKKAGNSSDKKRRPVDQWQIIGIIRRDERAKGSFGVKNSEGYDVKFHINSIPVL
jgi:hypothetical protein